MAINILDFQVANLIAAGEVVDRPASVLKELLENAIDAGATEIEAELRRGGVGYIRVTDNGCGMSKDDAELCILRHATSKIREARDLDSILTLGFRGEALAAISSVSQMSITTRRAEDALGTEVLCDCGRITAVRETGCRKGTTMVVRELFANVPARRKFLKRDQSEGMAAAAVLEKIALSHPEISFKLISDGAVRMQTAGDKKLYNAIYALLGRDFALRMILVRGKTEAVEVFGYIGMPDNTRPNRNYQNFFINGRYVKSRTATAALEQAYASFMESERFPCCVLNIVLHPALVDVNVHPTKLEVKFSSEKSVFDAIYLCCRNALLQDTAKPQMRLEKKDVDSRAIGTLNRFTPVYDRMDIPGSPVQTKIEDETPQTVQTDAPHAPFDDLPFIFDDLAKNADAAPQAATVPENAGQAPPAFPAFTGREQAFSGAETGVQTPTRPVPSETGASQTRSFDLSESGKTQIDPFPDGFPALAELIGGKAEKKEKTSPVPAPTAQNGEKEETPFKLLGIAFETYILAEVGDKLWMIDKHAAHERILFEKMKKNMASARNRFVQMLLLPEELQLGRAEAAAANDYRDELESAGFLFSTEEGSDVVIIAGFPGILEKEQAMTLFASVATDLAAGGGSAEVSRNNAFERILFTASCKAAMKGSRHDEEAHLAYIVRELLQNPDVRYCPHGRPVIFEIPKGSIEHRFQRS